MKLTGGTLKEPLLMTLLKDCDCGLFLLVTIHNWIEGVLIYLRECVVNTFCISGKDETKTEKLRSILAQFEYKYQIDVFNAKGIPFKKHLYVPEIHPTTQTGFCEREDEAHVLKVSTPYNMAMYDKGYSISAHWT